MYDDILLYEREAYQDNRNNHCSCGAFGGNILYYSAGNSEMDTYMHNHGGVLHGCQIYAAGLQTSYGI